MGVPSVVQPPSRSLRPRRGKHRDIPRGSAAVGAGMSPSRSLPAGSRMHSHPYSWNESLNPPSLLSRFTDDEIEGKVGGVFCLRWDSAQVAEASQDPCPEECLWVQDGAGGSPHLSQRGFASGTATEKRTLQTTKHSEVKPSPRAPSAAPRRGRGEGAGGGRPGVGALHSSSGDLLLDPRVRQRKGPWLEGQLCCWLPALQLVAWCP